jgi:enamine deaminase RidA (YjgF/YER057c/UK114 family)
MSNIARQHSNARMSKVVTHGGLVYLCGQTSGGKDLEGIAAQTVEVLERIDRLLAQAGSHRGQLLSVLIHLKSMDDFEGMNGVWENWLPPDAAPARTTVQASLAQDRLLVEMTVVAAVASTQQVALP